MAAFFVLFENDRALRRERVFRDRIDPLDKFTDYELIARYRFPRRTVLELTDLIRNAVQHPTSRSCAIPAHTQVSLISAITNKGKLEPLSNSLSKRAHGSCRNCTTTIFGPLYFHS